MMGFSTNSSDPPAYSLTDTILSSDEKNAPKSINGRMTVFSKEFRPIYRDIWAAIAFLVHIAVMIYISIYLYSIVDLSKADPRGTLSSILNEFRGISLGALFTVLGCSLVGALSLISIIFYCMKSAPSVFIKCSIFAYLTMIGLFFLQTLFSKAIVASVLLGIVLVINSIFFWRARYRIPLTALVLKSTLNILQLYPGLIFISLGQLVFQVVFASFSICTFIFLATATSQKIIDPAILVILFSFSALSLFWTAQVLMNVLHVTISGVFAGFYLTGGKYSSSISKCLGRALSTSFGSICFGSLIVSVIQTIRFLVRSLKDEKSVVGAIADCILGCIENLASYFNFFAYTELSIYGRSFISSAKDCWALIKRSGVELIVNDVLAGVVLTLGMLIVTVSGVLYGKLLVLFILSALITNQSMTEMYIIISALVFLLSYSMFAEMIRSGINTSIVCFCEEPQGLQNSNPLLYEKYTEIVSGYHA